MNRFVRTVSLLTIFLFLLSASINATLDKLETSPGRSQLVVYTPTGHLAGIYRGNLSQLAAVNQSIPTRLPLFLHHGRTTATAGETGWL
jgi:hypothetical protein